MLRYTHIACLVTLHSHLRPKQYLPHYHLSHTCYISSPSNFPRFDYPNNSLWKIQNYCVPRYAILPSQLRPYDLKTKYRSEQLCAEDLSTVNPLQEAVWQRWATSWTIELAHFTSNTSQTESVRKSELMMLVVVTWQLFCSVAAIRMFRGIGQVCWTAHKRYNTVPQKLWWRNKTKTSRLF